MRTLNSMMLVAALAVAGCTADVGGVSDGLHEDVVLCLDTVDCGGICGTEREVRAFLNACAAQNGDNGPVGPCFSDCWSACRLRAEHSQQPIACTMECMVGQCPASAAALLHAGDVTCPEPSPDTICITLYAPVDCGGCVYSNSCVAASAGFTAGQCTELGGSTEPIAL